MRLRARAVLEKKRRLEQARSEADAFALAPVVAPTFRGAALDVQSFAGREWILAGPSETGKTWATLWRLDGLLSSTPGAQAALVRKVAADIPPTVLVTYRRVIERSRSGAQAYGGEKPEWFDYPNGARLYIGGMDRPGKVLSGERDWIYANQAEELTLDDWETLSTRTTGRGAVTDTPMLFGDCNPGPEDHWILKRQALRVFHSKHEDNPSLFDEDGSLTAQGVRTMQTLDALTGIRKSRLRHGLWVGAEGLFFEEFDYDLHTCDPFVIPADWPMWGALDHGFAHNTAFGAFTQNQNDIYLVAEHVKNGWLVPQHCLAIRRQLERAGIAPSRIRDVVAGHDVFQKRGDSDGKTFADRYSAAADPQTGKPIGLHLTHANLDRITGARTLLELLGNKTLGIKPRLHIFRICPRTIAAMTRMVHDPRDPEDVLKVNADANGDGGDDEYDMLRYGVMNRIRASQRPAVGGQRTAVVNLRKGLLG